MMVKSTWGRVWVVFGLGQIRVNKCKGGSGSAVSTLNAGCQAGKNVVHSPVKYGGAARLSRPEEGKLSDIGIASCAPICNRRFFGSTRNRQLSTPRRPLPLVTALYKTGRLLLPQNHDGIYSRRTPRGNPTGQHYDRAQQH